MTPVAPSTLFEISGLWPARRLVLYFSRENLQVSDPSMARLRDHWVSNGWTFAQHYSPEEQVARLVRRGLESEPPGLRQRFIKAMRVLRRPRYWWYASARRRSLRGTVPARVVALREALAHFPPPQDWILVGRSAGARVATMAADELGAPAAICFGYPFRHPQRPSEPERVAHLATLRTPCLILQGRSDCYGGEAEAARHPLSSGIKLTWWETDHDFALSDEAWVEALAAIDEFLEEARCRGR